MRKILLLLLVFISGGFSAISQNLSYTCPRTITVSCGPACVTINARFPDIKALGDDYTFVNTTATSPCFPLVAPDLPGNPTSLSIDDTYSSVIPITFNFPFFGVLNTSLLVSTNGYLCFDLTKAGAPSHYGILRSGGVLSATTGTPENLPSLLYDKGLIMGPYHDLDPGVANSPTKQIKYDILGTAPNRRFIVSFYKEPLFLGACNSLIENTHQIILHESSGIIEVFVKDKQICNGWNQGRAMIGLQDMTRTKWIMAPGRMASDAPWGTIGMNETWRFIPKNGLPLYRTVQLLDATGTVIETGDTSRVDANTFEWNFNNACPPPNTTTLYVVKTTYQRIDNPGTYYSLDTINILRTNSLPASITQNPTTCGASVGSVTVTPSAGTSPYTYTLNGGAPVNAPGAYTFPNLAAGPYTVVVTDATGCTNTLNITVTTNTTITGTITATATSCPLSGDGTITVTPTTGTAPYTYSLDGSAPQAGGIFTNVAPGPHTVVFTDVFGCTGSLSINVVAGSTPLTATFSSTATSCPGVNNGTITVTPTSGTPAYQYSLDGGPNQLGNTFTNVAAGPHTVTFTDSKGCTGTVIVNVAAGAALTANISSTTTSCPAVNNGTITVTPTSGTGPYQYSLDGGPNQPGNTFTNVAAGFHSVTFTDAIGCTGTVSTNVAAGPNLTANILTTPTSCPTVSDGTITVTPTNGTGPYQYALDAGPNQPGNIFTNVTAGAHTIRVTDANGCMNNFPVNVAQGAPLTSTNTTTNPPCSNVNNGTITITPTSGTGPYQYTLNGGPPQASNVFTGLAPGAYTINFTDAMGCSGTNNTTLTTNPAITATSTNVMPLCNGNANGSITLNVLGGVAPYQYSINGGSTYQVSPTFAGLAAGTYNFLVKDAAGCIYNFSFTLAQPPVLTAFAAATATATCPNNDGSLTITAGGGTPTYQYSIDNGLNYQAGNVFTNLPIGNYNNIKVKDANGCVTNTSTVIALNDTMRLELGPDSTICVGSSLVLLPQTNAATDTFKWTPSTGLDYDTAKNPVASPNDTTKYYLTAKWGICQRTDSIRINILHKPVAHAGNDTTICYKTNATLNGWATNLSGAVNYAWTPPDSLNTPNAASTIARMDTTRQFTLTVTDNYGCNFSVSDSMWVFMQPVVPAFAGNDTNAMARKPHQLYGSGAGTSGTYLWSPTGPLDNPFIQNPKAVLSNDTYFTLLVTDAIGCTAEDGVFIKVYDGPEYYVPNAFTPNGDGLNDIFRPIPSGMTTPDYFRVFNRFGQLVFQTNKWLEGWDGKFKGKDAQQGTYVWMIKGRDVNGRVVEMQGTVILLR